MEPGKVLRCLSEKGEREGARVDLDRRVLFMEAHRAGHCCAVPLMCHALARQGGRRTLETFTEAREWVRSARYAQHRRDALAALDLESIDAPILDIVTGFAALRHCFTLQSCYGHFLCGPDQSRHTLERIADDCRGAVTYRIAYLAWCLENSRRGRALREALGHVPEVAPGYVQFGSADWFWERWVNSYVLQVEPVAHRLKDEAVLEPAEALRTEMARDLFFGEIRALLAAEMKEHRAR